MSFDTFGLPETLLQVLAAQGYTNATPVQQQAIPAILDKKDVLGIAKTGSGKTVSYALPVLMNLQDSKVKNRHANALVLVPTRELAVQVSEVFFHLNAAFKPRIKTLAVYGGVSINPQMINLQGVQVIVATPGRLLELVENNAVSLSEIKMLVLDEADKMLNLGFKDEVDRILALLPQQRQNMLFSATLNEELEVINRHLLNAPLVIHMEEPEENIDLITQTAYAVMPEKKGPLLRYLINHYNMKQVLVFTSSVYQADNVTDNSIKTESMHGPFTAKKARDQEPRH